ncbi:hypothetical protein NQ314_004959 [Rhamnusium bicolor]|uniref:Uncharacterized protein n=1 Tax=Rhamnusium bicolor TaxID=1586634 RepID=A0AAV8ZI79_9CUCU|nr:hypothetical protein NQ314_004959 [Rhamnusium bicolor]
MGIYNISDTQPLLYSSNKPPKKSIKTRRAPRAPEPKNEDLDAILPYEEPVKTSKPPEAQNNRVVQNSNNNEEQTEHSTEAETAEVKEIKPKTFTGKFCSL